MQHLKILFQKDLPLRPLLLAVGAAVTTAGVYYFMKKKRDDEEKTAEHAQISNCDEPEMNRVLLSQKEELQKLCEKEELLKVTAAEAESKNELATEKCEQRMESNTHLEKEKSELMSADVMVQQLKSEKLVLQEKVDTLQNTVESLTNLLSQTLQECVKAITEQAIVKGVHEFAMSEAKEREKELKRKRESLEVALENTERNNQDMIQKLEDAAQINIDLEYEISELTLNLELVREKLVNTEEALASSRGRCKELTAECELKEQQVLDQDWKLRSLTTTMRSDLHKERKAHSRLEAQHEKLLQEHEKVREAHRIMTLEYDQMKKTLDNGSEGKDKQVTGYNARLERESELTHHVHTLKDRLQDGERAREEYSILLSQFEELLKQRDKLSMEREQMAHSSLDNKMKETPSHYETSQSVTLDEAEEKYKPVMESSAQTENERFDITSLVSMFKDLVQQMKEQLCEKDRNCVEKNPGPEQPNSE